MRLSEESGILAMLFLAPSSLFKIYSEVLVSLVARNMLGLAMCLFLAVSIMPSAEALKATANLEPDHTHLDVNIVAKYPEQKVVGDRQIRFSSLWSFSKILLMTRGAINDTYSEQIGDQVYIRNFTMSLMIGSTQTSLMLGYDIHGVVESSFALGGTSFRTDCRWRYVSIDKRYPVGGEIWVNLSQTLFLNFSCFRLGLNQWKKTMVGARTFFFQNVSSFEVPYQVGSRIYKVRLDPSMQIVTPSNAYDVSQTQDHISFRRAILPMAYIVVAVLLVVVVVFALAHPRVRRLWKYPLPEQTNT